MHAWEGTTMDRTAPVDHPILEPLAKRWSPRAFDPRPVPPEALRSMFEAARWAPSSFNEQPWAFLVAVRERPDEFERALAGLNPWNRAWAKNAGALAFTVAKRDLARNGRPNRHAWHDLGQAAAYLAAQAAALGLAAHQMGGILPDEVRRIYGVPDGWDLPTGIAIGWPGDPASLPEDYREDELAPRERKRQAEFVFSGGWGRAAVL